MLKINGLTKHYNDTVILDNINLEFNTGLNFILGPSGCGKSTLLRLIGGIEKEYDGEILFDGKNIKELNNEALTDYYFNDIGFVWQSFNLLNHLSVEDNVKTILELTDLSEEDKNKKVRKVLSQMKINKLAKQKVNLLSGGQKQRVAIARALVKDPSVILADEPTGALDEKTSKKIMGIFKQIAKERTVIIVTHDEGFEDFGNKIVRFSHGSVDEVIDTTEVVSSKKQRKVKKSPLLSLGRASKQAKRNIKGMYGKFLATCLVIVIVSSMLVFNGSISDEQGNSLAQIEEEFGSDLKTLTLVENLKFNATMGQDSEERRVTQDISEAIEKLQNDERVEYMYSDFPLFNIGIEYDGEEVYRDNSNGAHVPSFGDILHGEYPNNDEIEVLLPLVLTERITDDPESLIGKEITFTMQDGAALGAEGPDAKRYKITAKISGIIDAEYEDQYVGSKAFYKKLEEEIMADGYDAKEYSVMFRVKTLEDTLAINDELSQMGIESIGSFAMVEDMVRLSLTNNEQLGSVLVIMLGLSLVALLAVAFISCYTRKIEYAILKLNGYSKQNIFKLAIVEYVYVSAIAMGLYTICFPIFSAGLESAMNFSLPFNFSTITTGFILIAATGLTIGVLVGLIGTSGNAAKTIKEGER